MLNQCGQKIQRKETHRINIYIVGVCGTKCENNGHFVTDRHRFMYAVCRRKKNDGRLRLERFIRIKCKWFLIKLKGNPFKIFTFVRYIQSTEEEINNFNAHWQHHDPMQIAENHICHGRQCTHSMHSETIFKVRYHNPSEISILSSVGSEKWISPEYILFNSRRN